MALQLVHLLQAQLLVSDPVPPLPPHVPELAFPNVSDYLPATMPPLGRPLRDLWTFAPGWTNLNHGSYGAPPKAVVRVKEAWTGMMEANPELFIRWQAYPALDRVRAMVADYVHADADDIAFVENASHGMNAVLRSLCERMAGTTILHLNLAYPMVKNTLNYCADHFGVELLNADVHGDGLTVGGVVNAVRAALESAGGAVKVVVVSHITSTPALVMPVAELADLAHEHGALLAVDGAHALGQIAVDVSTWQVDFWVANGHKWLLAPKGAAVLWTRREHQHLIYPTTINQEGIGASRYQRDFSYQGARGRVEGAWGGW